MRFLLAWIPTTQFKRTVSGNTIKEDAVHVRGESSRRHIVTGAGGKMPLGEYFRSESEYVVRDGVHEIIMQIQGPG